MFRLLIGLAVQTIVAGEWYQIGSFEDMGFCGK